MTQQLKRRTEFQGRVLRYVISRGHHGADCWEIAQGEFPEKWKHRAGRGALVGHIDRAGSSLSELVRLPPKDRFDSPSFFQKGLFKEL